MAEKMRRVDRAKQFLPFNSLRGFYDLVRIKEKIITPRRELTTDELEKKYLLNTVNELLLKYDLNSLSGATLLGVNKVIMKGHGNANEKTIYNIVKQVYNLIENDLIEKLATKMNVLK